MAVEGVSTGVTEHVEGTIEMLQFLVICTFARCNSTTIPLHGVLLAVPLFSVLPCGAETTSLFYNTCGSGIV